MEKQIAMHKLFTIDLNGKRYLTTIEANAWDFCTRFGAQVIKVTQTNRVIDGVEYQERTFEEIYVSVKRMVVLRPSIHQEES